ncbi:MAG TPA: methionyl-tRNA formyltransferase, partial [Candidatus Sulfotelmatobacter sp.]|nr:methionyl-tRNA formyltransferase [Candidatus Sulfotelmatobacter sp.]
MGTPALAAHILERLVTASGASSRVVATVTRPDTPRGRGLGMEPSEVGVVASKYKIPTLKPVKIRTTEFLNELKAFEPDLLVVAAYGRILPNAILEVPRIAPMNVHASLLPRHRGAAPIEGAILAGDAETGVTIMRIVEQMDAGPMYFQRKIPIEPSDTQGTLKEKLARVGADAMLEAIELAARGALVETMQDEALATYTAQVEKKDA